MTELGAPPPSRPHLLYLHGFRSSPQSFKAQRLQAWIRHHRPDVHLWIPQLPPSPRAALDLLQSGTADWPCGHALLMGSSLGGFYATVLAQSTGWPAVVINPAVDPARDLQAYIGELSAFHDPEERFFFRAEYIPELQSMTPGPLCHPERLMAVIATGDELLDWREMHARYQGAHQLIVDGSDHALSDFDQHLPAILHFLQLCD